jgi:hypothetical protein
MGCVSLYKGNLVLKMELAELLITGQSALTSFDVNCYSSSTSCEGNTNTGKLMKRVRVTPFMILVIIARNCFDL